MEESGNAEERMQDIVDEDGTSSEKSPFSSLLISEEKFIVCSQRRPYLRVAPRDLQAHLNHVHGIAATKKDISFFKRNWIEATILVLDSKVAACSACEKLLSGGASALQRHFSACLSQNLSIAGAARLVKFSVEVLTSHDHAISNNETLRRKRVCAREGGKSGCVGGKEESSSEQFGVKER